MCVCVCVCVSQGLEITSVVLAAVILCLEILDVSMWIVGVALRRRLMKKNIPYIPPLYPIPGKHTHTHTHTHAHTQYTELLLLCACELPMQLSDPQKGRRLMYKRN